MFGGQLNGPQQSGGGSPFRGIMGLVVFGLVIYLAFTVFAWLYAKLWYAVPFVLGAVALLDPKLLLGIFRRLGELTGRNPIAGLIVGAIFCFSLPFFSLILLVIALVRRSMRKKMSEHGEQSGQMFDMFMQQAQGRRGSEPQNIDIEYEELPADTNGNDLV